MALLLRFLYNVPGLCTNQLVVQCDDQFQLLILSSSSSSYNVTNVSRDDTSSQSNCAQCLQSNCLAASLSKSFSPLSRFIKCLALLQIVATLAPPCNKQNEASESNPNDATNEMRVTTNQLINMQCTHEIFSVLKFVPNTMETIGPKTL